MITIDVIYHSKTGNTKRVAEEVIKGIEETEGELKGLLNPVPGYSIYSSTFELFTSPMDN